MTLTEYNKALLEFGLRRIGEPFNGVIPYETLDGSGKPFVLDTSDMTNSERRDWFEFQKSTGRFTEFGH